MYVCVYTHFFKKYFIFWYIWIWYFNVVSFHIFHMICSFENPHSNAVPARGLMAVIAVQSQWGWWHKAMDQLFFLSWIADCLAFWKTLWRWLRIVTNHDTSQKAATNSPPAPDFGSCWAIACEWWSLSLQWKNSAPDLGVHSMIKHSLTSMNRDFDCQMSVIEL